jgi:hypothetical protein
MSWSYNKSGSVAIYDDGWQYPAITEKHAAYQVRDLPYELPFQYIGFPWATLTDFENRAKKAEVDQWLEKLMNFSGPSSPRRITTAQHISTFKRIPFYKKIGITDIFWAHATTDTFLIDGVRIHPFPLYPVQTPKIDMKQSFIDLSAPRKFLFSFVGTYNPKGYISDIRKVIYETFKHPNACIIERKEWHYEKLVYQKQIDKADLSNDVQSEYDKNSEEYKSVLADSTFSLCPSGSGPNSIRLLESIGALSIPVVFSDNLRLPGDQSLWDRAILRYPDQITSAEDVMKDMEKIANDPQKLADMRKACADIWMRYGSHNFIYDLTKLAGAS